MNKATMESKRSEDSDDVKIEKVVIKRQITLLHGVAIIVGIIIGSGIFVSPVGILKEVKSVGFSLVMWVLCGIYNTLCAICYAELGTTIPESGGEYIYIKRAFGDIPAFICLWINFLLICPVGIAASALIFSLYILKPVFPDCDIPEEGLALLAACIFCKYFYEQFIAAAVMVIGCLFPSLSLITVSVTLFFTIFSYSVSILLYCECVLFHRTLILFYHALILSGLSFNYQFFHLFFLVNRILPFHEQEILF